MALDINGCNATFKAFTDFATQSVKAGDTKAIARAGGEGALADRTITAAQGDSLRHMFKWTRSKDNQTANNATRALFKEAVAGMFGGEDNIPASVKKAMLMGDYGKGKPLTARRIIAVRTAIEKVKTETFSLANAFESGDYPDEMKMKAENAGHVATDFPKLSKGANLLAKATGMPLRSALLEVMDKSSAAYATVQFGPLYTGSVADFKKGMEIQKEFKKLQTGLTDLVRRAVSGGDAKDYAGIARIRVEQLKIAKQQAANLFAMQTVVDMSDDKYTELMEKIDSSIQDFEKAAKDIDDGLVEGEANLYARTIGNKKMDGIASAFNMLGIAIHRKCNDGDPVLMKAISVTLKNICEMCVSGERDNGYNVFKQAFAERETPKLTERFHGAESQGKFKLPAQFYDSIGINLKKHLFEGVDAFEQLAAKLGTESERSKVSFSDDQKKRLKAVISQQAGEETASRLIDRFVAEIETICLNNAVTSTVKNQQWDENFIEGLVAHFEKHPGLAKAFALGFKEDRLDEVKADLAKVMTASFANNMQKRVPSLSTLEPGFMPQAIREYNKGYVTFNGEPLRDGVSGKLFMEANNDERKGYCEFLEEKFDDQHVQMRRFVSFVCGMADGLSGAINTGAFSGTGGLGNNPDLVKSPQRDSGYYMDECKVNVISGNRDNRDNYDIRIDDKSGDVTIKFTHYETNCLSCYVNDKNEQIPLAKADGDVAEMAKTRMEVTMVITNALDSELGDKNPEFTITEIKQEVV